MKSWLEASLSRVRGLGVNFGFLVFMLVFVACLAASVGYTVYRLRTQAIADAGRVAALQARAIEDHLTQSLNIVDQVLGNLSAEDPADRRFGRQLEVALAASPALRSLSLLGSDGRIVASSNLRNIGTTVETGDPLPSDAAGVGLLRVGRPWTGRDFGEGLPPGHAAGPADKDLAFIPVLRAVGGGKLGAMLAAVNPDYFMNHYDARLRPQSGFVDVFRYDGTKLLSTREGAGDAGSEDFMRDIADVEFGNFEETLPDGMPVISAFRASRQYPLVAVARIPLDAALADWRSESQRLLLITAPMLFAVTLLTTLLFLHLRRIEEAQAEARQREHDRLAARDQLRAVIEASPEAVLLVDGDGTILHANKVCERVFGFAPAELIGTDVNRLVPIAARARHIRHVVQYARDPHSRPMGSGVQLSALRRDGSEFQAEISLSPLALEGRMAVIATITDITDRIRNEETLRSAKEAAEALLARASMAERHIVDISEQTQERIGQELHDDLGQHLTGAAFISELLYRKLESMALPEREDAATVTRLINEAVGKTRTLAHGLYPVELREAGLRSMIEQLARNVERTYDITCTVTADEGFAVDDPGIAINLFRVTQEAISNAIRHGNATAVRIGLRRPFGSMRLEIEDNGRGLGAAPAGKGGLGMHTMRYRAALVGAALRIETGASGGVRVVIALPLSEESGNDAVQHAT